MTDPAFLHLVDLLRDLHRSHAGLGDFVPFAHDLRATGFKPFHIPASDLLQAETRLSSPDDLAPLRDAFVAAAPLARWRETYKDTDIGDDFLNRFGCYCLIGPDAPFVSDQMGGWVVYMPPHLDYTWHHHPAEEMYVVLAGEAEFRREGEAPETLRAGDTSFHASNQPHAMTTHDHPVMCYVTWRNNLHTPPVLSPRAVVHPAV